VTALVVDASVALKWAFPDGTEELEDAALPLLHRFVVGDLRLIQPPHWLAEVSAVLARKAPGPGEREQAIGFFYALEPETPDSPALYLRAADLAARLDHHLFDTLYHAVALEHGVQLITADTAYFHKAGPEGANLGAIQHLADLPPHLSPEPE
jgi:predicted nucleic acid-binding protein